MVGIITLHHLQQSGKGQKLLARLFKINSSYNWLAAYCIISFLFQFIIGFLQEPYLPILSSMFSDNCSLSIVTSECVMKSWIWPFTIILITSIHLSATLVFGTLEPNLWHFEGEIRVFDPFPPIFDPLLTF